MSEKTQKAEQEAAQLELLFAYGTLQDAELQRILFGAPCRMRKAALPGWTLHVAPEGWLFIKPDPAGCVSGSLLELDAEALRGGNPDAVSARKGYGQTGRRRRTGGVGLHPPDSGGCSAFRRRVEFV